MLNEQYADGTFMQKLLHFPIAEHFVTFADSRTPANFCEVGSP